MASSSEGKKPWYITGEGQRRIFQSDLTTFHPRGSTNDVETLMAQPNTTAPYNHRHAGRSSKLLLDSNLVIASFSHCIKYASGYGERVSITRGGVQTVKDAEKNRDRGGGAHEEGSIGEDTNHGARRPAKLIEASRGSIYGRWHCGEDGVVTEVSGASFQEIHAHEERDWDGERLLIANLMEENTDQYHGLSLEAGH
ncbi:hypothetical protein P692DRAFT_201802757 [Suillus brevipes Sb2]|nr:hypothetical protein P692DRAFT_201802757 [Suillus brevipes Sb2]